MGRYGPTSDARLQQSHDGLSNLPYIELAYNNYFPIRAISFA